MIRGLALGANSTSEGASFLANNSMIVAIVCLLLVIFVVLLIAEARRSKRVTEDQVGKIGIQSLGITLSISIGVQLLFFAFTGRPLPTDSVEVRLEFTAIGAITIGGALVGLYKNLFRVR